MLLFKRKFVAEYKNMHSNRIKMFQYIVVIIFSYLDKVVIKSLKLFYYYLFVEVSEVIKMLFLVIWLLSCY